MPSIRTRKILILDSSGNNPVIAERERENDTKSITRKHKDHRFDHKGSSSLEPATNLENLDNIGSNFGSLEILSNPEDTKSNLKVNKNK